METADQLQAQLHSVQDFLRWAVSEFGRAGLFFGHGSDNAVDEAAYLLCWSLDLPPEQLNSFLASRLTDSEKRAVVELLLQRIRSRKPASYLTREAWFAGLSFYVDERVLVPRSPLAELIEAEFQPWIGLESVGSVLDLCTGSGCIAIATALSLPQTRVDGADLSADALAVAARNVTDYALGDRITLYQGDLFQAIGGAKYDLILCNPPYVSPAEMAALPAEYRHEPVSGLAAADEGLICALQVLAEASDHLNPGGTLLLEVGASQPALERRLPQVPFTWLEFERGGEGILLIDQQTLADQAVAVSAAWRAAAGAGR
ncbi:MAG: 50S ribosomal protein L3 N(5)-glutamine methyltransferase [Gammaproteobacteria bacterium]|nr:50S ribosomal protein L3 N(5)-glutamine methyltransferase [Gammaproteobacteria bacterium]